MSITAAVKELVTVIEVEVSIPMPQLFANAASVQKGEEVRVTVLNGPASASGKDWIGLYLLSQTNNATFLTKLYMSGTGSVLVPPAATTFIVFTMPTTADTYNFRFFSDDSFTLLATSPSVVVL